VATYQKAMQLRTQFKWSAKRIARFLNINSWTVGCWVYDGCRPDSGINIPNFEDVKTLSYIVGVLEGDGSKGERSVTLSVKSQEFAKEFAQALETIHIPPKWSNYHLRTGGLIWRVFGCSKILSEWYGKLDIEKFALASDETARMFLKGFFESEGTFDSKRLRIHIYNSDVKRIEITTKCLERLGFRVAIDHVKSVGRKQRYTVRILGGGNEAKRFLAIIKPCIKSDKRNCADEKRKEQGMKEA